MQYPLTFSEFTLTKLSPQLIEKYADPIIETLDQIPLVEKHSIDQLLSEIKGERRLFSKWEHSLFAIDNHNEFAGLIVGYERKSEGNEQYPYNSIYLNDLAVAKKHQHKGLGRFLVKTWIEHNTQLGFLNLTGSTKLTVQTNAAPWNKNVQDLYTSLGFCIITTKTYENRVDNVYVLIPNTSPDR